MLAFCSLTKVPITQAKRQGKQLFPIQLSILKMKDYVYQRQHENHNFWNERAGPVKFPP